MHMCQALVGKSLCCCALAEHGQWHLRKWIDLCITEQEQQQSAVRTAGQKNLALC
jgi:hypothetical protein